MGNKTKIAWTHMEGFVGATWNFIIGCLRKSTGCTNCYAERQVHRGLSPQHKGLTKLTKKGPVWNGKLNVAEHRLDEPLRKTKPTMYFVNSLSDLFFGPVPFELIAASLAVMAASPRHIFQILTKRPERASDFFAWLEDRAHEVSLKDFADDPDWCRLYVLLDAARKRGIIDVADRADILHSGVQWPLPNVWLGVSVEDQETADNRVRELRELPAAVHWISQEPQLGPIEYRNDVFEWKPLSPDENGESRLLPPIRWVVVGGQSGPGARPFEIEWGRRTAEQCRAAAVPIFMKQLGAVPVQVDWVDLDWPEGTKSRAVPELGGSAMKALLKHRRGEDMAEWPEDLRVQQWPAS